MLTAASPEPGRLVTATVERLDLPSLNARQAILDAAITPSRSPAPSRNSPCSTLSSNAIRLLRRVPDAEARIVFWNAERLKYLDQSIAMLSALNEQYDE